MHQIAHERASAVDLPCSPHRVGWHDVDALDQRLSSVRIHLAEAAHVRVSKCEEWEKFKLNSYVRSIVGANLLVDRTNKRLAVGAASVRNLSRHSVSTVFAFQCDCGLAGIYLLGNLLVAVRSASHQIRSRNGAICWPYLGSDRQLLLLLLLLMSHEMMLWRWRRSLANALLLKLLIRGLLLWKLVLL
jgi:hypothetical protein